MKSQKFNISKLPFRSAKAKLEEPPIETKKEPTQEEVLANIGKDEEADSDGEDCELHIYEQRYDTRGGEVFLRAGRKSEVDVPSRRSRRACLVLTRHYTFDNQELESTELEIQSLPVIKALREVIGTYDGVDFTPRYVNIQEPPMCLFHFKDELRQHADSSDNQQLKSHMNLCLQYLEKTLHREFNIYRSFISTLSLSPGLEHRHLWLAFKPGCLLYMVTNGTTRLVRLRSIRYKDDYYPERRRWWKISAEIIQFIQKEIGVTSRDLEIAEYSGCRQMTELPVIPLQFHPDKEQIQHDLLERGKKFLSLCGIHHCSYDGLAYLCRGVVSFDAENTSNTNVKGRVVIDPEEYQRHVSSKDSKVFLACRSKYNFAGGDDLHFSDEDTMICSPFLPGYSLGHKKWGYFLVTDIGDVAYNDTAFEHLVLSEQKKTLISSLVMQQSVEEQDQFDDLIKGKGKGLVFLLYGPPGVGKTYTAEGIADHTRRPLLKITSGELGGGASAHWVEDRLSTLFSLVARWKGIMLLDEADVFMQERSVNDLDRNWLVSTLLRVLEYNEGIIFLTTNRVKTIDDAFKSRIHLSIAYPTLSEDARAGLWKSTIMRATGDGAPGWLTPSFLHQLVEANTNGREIKNIVRAGYTLARNEAREMTTSDLLQSLEALKQFEIDFNKLPGETN